MKKIPYLIDSNVATPAGPIQTFNGETSDTIENAKFNSRINTEKVYRVDCDNVWRYFRGGMEYDMGELFIPTRRGLRQSIETLYRDKREAIDSGDSTRGFYLKYKAESVTMQITGICSPYDAYDYLADVLGWDI